MENEKLIKKIAWSFAQTTGLEYDDLYQEASLAYLEALSSHDPSRGRITTHLHTCVSNRLKNYIKKQEKFLPLDDLDFDKPHSSSPFWEELSRNALSVAEIILESPEGFLRLTKRESTKKVKKILLEKGWGQRRIQKGFNELKIAFS
jgi:DNA-directed RNA polymerase specialized sigma24 family protein